MVTDTENSGFVKLIEEYVTFVTICPEVSIGLSVPRESIRMVFGNEQKQLLSYISGVDYTKEMYTFAQSYSKNIKNEGFFGGAVLEHNMHLPIEDEGRLLNYDIRDHFLTRIFTLARFESIKEKPSMGALVKFHSEHKYLLMAYHQTKQKELGVVF